jgi:phosphonoacetaldehyde hydrolase
VRRVEAVIFDWAGTTVDHGSLAPVRALTELFADCGVPLSGADARRDMGLFKKDHIRRILALPNVSEAWRAKYGAAPAESDVERLFEGFSPVQMKILEKHAGVIGGVAPLTERLRGRGLRIGSTTGYTRPMLDVLLAEAARQGFSPDVSLCPDDVGGGRPHPWMCLRIAMEFRVSSTSACVKVGDTPVDIHEGLNAGMWVVGVSRTGNELGMSEAELANLAEPELLARNQRACAALSDAGAHYVVESAALLEPVLEMIDKRMGAGERP